MRNQRDEIATILKQFVKKLLGFFAGEFSEEIQKQSESRQHQTYPNHRPHTNIIEIDHSRFNLSSILTAKYAHTIAESNSIVNTRKSVAGIASRINPAERSDKIEEIILKWLCLKII